MRSLSFPSFDAKCRIRKERKINISSFFSLLRCGAWHVKRDEDEHEGKRAEKSSGKMLICGKFAVMRVASEIRESSQPWRTTTEEWKLFILSYCYVYFKKYSRNLNLKGTSLPEKRFLANSHRRFSEGERIFPFSNNENFIDRRVPPFAGNSIRLFDFALEGFDEEVVS